MAQIGLCKDCKFWKDLNNLQIELEKISEEIGHFPSETELRRMGYSGLPSAIRKYHGGMHKIRDLLNVKQAKRKDGVWKNLEYAMQQSRSTSSCTCRGGTLPAV